MYSRSKTTSILALIFVLSMLLANCAPQSQTSDTRTVTIAVVENDPGEVGNPNPQSAYAGMLLASEQMKLHNGINLKIVPYADQGDPEIARQKAEEIAASDAIAVVGHSSIETSRAAAAIYSDARIPVLNYVPVTDELTSESQYYFNTTYTAELEAAYLANYLRKINNVETASIISTDDGYGQTLARQFKNTFNGLGGRVTVESVVSTANMSGLEDAVTSIILANPETDNPGTIFIAADEKTAAELVILMKQKGIAYPIVGASTLSSPVFMKTIEDQPEERTIPGYYTDGILTTRALIFDSANRYANQFISDYQSAYQDDPGDRVVNGYDAALVLMAGVRSSNITSSADNVKANRGLLYKSLLDINDSKSSVQGLVSQIHFEPSRNILRAARFGVYQNGKIVSANIQFEPITTPSEIKNLQELLDNGRVMTVNGAYVYKANVVYAGVDLLSISEIDIKTSTYKMDFYLWFRYRPNDQDDGFQPDDFVFTNADGDTENVLLREEENTDGTHLKTYRVSGVFKNQFRFYEYPFDHQNLIVEFRNQNANTSFIQYVVDQIGMRYDDEATLLKNFSDNGAFDEIFGWDKKAVHVTQDIFPTFSTFGSPQNFDSKVATNYSLINVNVDVQRSSLQYIIKSLLPLLITLVLAYITFFLPLGHDERLAVGSTALLTTAFFHLTLADALPEIGYTVAMEYLFYASYMMSALIVLLETLSIRYEKFGEDAKKKADKELFQERRERLNTLGRIVYPLILLSVMVAGVFVYNGSISLGPKEAGSRHLVEFILDRSAPDAQSTTGATTVDKGDQIELTLSTWRPEDDTDLQHVLDAFHEYALNTLKKDITVKHKPVVSVNYDSILDIQLGDGKGPDLFYVRPFSVDGSIAKYLEPLDDNVLHLTENYELTKRIPWMSSADVYYAMPYVGVVQGVYYNKELFDQYGISIPQTWGEFLVAIDEIKKQNPNIIPIANGLNPDEDSEMFMSIAANFLGGPDGRERLMRTNGTSLCYNSSRVVDSFRTIANLKPYLPDNAAEIRSQASKELFFNEQAVMVFGGSWDLQKVDMDAKFDWGVFAVPAPALKQTYVIFQPDIGIGINKDSAHTEEALEFLKWMTTKEAVELTAKNLIGFYPLNINTPSTSSGPNDQKFLDLVREYPSDIRWMFTEISNEYPRADVIIRRDLNRIMLGEITPEQAAQNLQDGLGEWYEPAQTCMK